MSTLLTKIRKLCDRANEWEETKKGLRTTLGWYALIISLYTLIPAILLTAGFRVGSGSPEQNTPIGTILFMMSAFFLYIGIKELLKARNEIE